MKYQRKNGSLFNSPSTTAAALTHLKDGRCLEYLRSLSKVFGHAVPTTYPLDKYTQLHMIDNLEKLGIARHFSKEIKGTLDETYDPLAQFSGEEFFFDSLGCHIKDSSTVLELHKASQIMTCSKELVLEKLNSWYNIFVIIVITDATISAIHFRSCNIGSKDILELAVKDFDFCQVIHQELEHLDRWVKENRFNQLKFARQKLTYSYFSAAATLFSPDLSVARMSWAKNALLATVVDDFYNIGGSREELVNLIQLVEKWDGNSAAASCSDQVKIIFSGIYNAVNQLGVKAYAWQGRNVAHYIIEIWLNLLKSMMKEAEWQLNKSVPTVDEYMKNAHFSFGLWPVLLPALYFVGPELPEEFVRCSEFHTLFKLLSTCGRLLNDTQTFQGSLFPRECKDLFWMMSKIIHLFYMRNDGYTSPKEMYSYCFNNVIIV
ncbi:ent-kaur-16-ene synthase, chloroplastic-like protein [Cinnamomum micranthum f. kanehirae]|uniref:Ent-kaur-16-ene synthase, chloroplastic-like protein n=1 Tax=Cinnamomum micranthum f. kanehirae TaxID=337451 RepID=A0A3S3NAS6_9MAGN|nr:ent-kaur-16-ene synthase, chloroplastic-like protein [Cinnamomum micranthum f. kanehirae]